LDRAGVTEVLISLSREKAHNVRGCRTGIDFRCGEAIRFVWLQEFSGRTKNWARFRITNGRQSFEEAGLNVRGSCPKKGELFRIAMPTVPVSWIACIRGI